MKFDLLHSGIHVGMLAIIGAPVIAFATFHPVSAQVPQSTEPMEMGQAVLAAIQVHPSIRGARAQERQAAEAVEVAKAGYRPQISGGLESQINSYRNSSYDSRSVYTATLNASQMLLISVRSLELKSRQRRVFAPAKHRSNWHWMKLSPEPRRRGSMREHNNGWLR